MKEICTIETGENVRLSSELDEKTRDSSSLFSGSVSKGYMIWLSILAIVALLTWACRGPCNSTVQTEAMTTIQRDTATHDQYEGLSNDFNRCKTYLNGWDWGSGNLSFILTADPGDFSGVSEAHHLLKNLKGRQDLPRDRTVCGLVSMGRLMGQPVLIITTGIGASAAAMCTLELLKACGPISREALYFGTSGWSPQVGGLLNPDSDGKCSQIHLHKTVARIGDVCISPLSVNWVCKKASWDMQSEGQPNQCTRVKEVAGPMDSDLFGECAFYKDNLLDNLALADQVIKVATSSKGSSNFPSRSINVTSHEERYWEAVAKGAGKTAVVLQPQDPPNIWGYDSCMEVDGNFFFSGSPWELQAREYAASTLQAARDFYLLHKGVPFPTSPATASSWLSPDHNHSSGGSDVLYQEGHSSNVYYPHKGDLRTSAIDMIAVSAMEGIGVSETGPDMWRVSEEIPEDFVNGYARAIATGSAAILNFYQERCLMNKASTGSRVESQCEFDIDSEAVLNMLVQG